MGIVTGSKLGALLLALCSLPQLGAQQTDAAKIYSQSSNSVLLILLKSVDSKIVAQGTLKERGSWLKVEKSSPISTSFKMGLR